MANKKTRVSYKGMNQDIAKNKVQSDQYYEAWNMKLTPVEGETFGTISNSYGNEIAVVIPRPTINVETMTINYGEKSLSYNNNEINDLPKVSGKQLIIGHIETTTGAIIFSTDEILDCIWNIPNLDQDILDIELLYMRSMKFSIENPIQALFNYENSLIQKVYWVDGKNYLRFLNIEESIDNGFSTNLIDIPVASINSKSTIDISRPTVEDGGGGGVHTAGVIQYAYTLYNLNGAETSLSPLSDLFPLDKGVGQGGGDVNEVVGALPIVKIEEIDVKYEYLKLYSVKYTEYNGVPEIKLISDGTIGNYDLFTFNDTGTRNLGNLGIAEFLFLGADPIKPSHIVAKDSILFASNTLSTAYLLDIDTRAYAFNKEGDKSLIYSNVTYNGIGDIPYTGDVLDVEQVGFDGVNEKFDAVNLNFDTYRYKDFGNTGNTGQPLLTNAIYAKDVEGKDTVNFFTGAGDTVPQTLSATCDPGNEDVKIQVFPLTPIGGTGDKYTIPETGDIKVGFVEASEWSSASAERIRISSVDSYVEVYANASSTTIIDRVKMDKKYVDFYIFTKTLALTAGQAIRTVSEVRYHYNNDTCPYQADDPNATYSYSGDGPYIGPNETGDTESLDYTFIYAQYSATKIFILEDYVELPLVATNGEAAVVNGKWVANYTGTIDLVLNSSVNMKGVALENTTLYSLGLFRNGIIVNSSQLNLGSAGIVVNTFNLNGINVEFGDEVELKLINNQSIIGEHKIATQDFDFTASGGLDIVSAVSAGTNGEGGSGKYLNYELTRSSLDEVNIPLRQAKFFKDNEIYRIGIVFYNSIGQSSEAKWIADFKAPEGNLEGQYNTLEVSFTAAFYAFISTLDEEDVPSNYSIVRALRNSTDKTIVSQGIMTSMFVQDYTKEYSTTDTHQKRADKNNGLVKTPLPLSRGYGPGMGVDDSYYPIFPTSHNRSMNESKATEDPNRPSGDQDTEGKNGNDIVVDEIYRDRNTERKRQQSWQYTKMIQMYSPEATFHFPISTTDKDELHLLGYMPRKVYEYWSYNIDGETSSPELNYKSPVGTKNFYPHEVGGFGIIGPSYRTWYNNDARAIYTGYDTKAPAGFARRLHIHKTFNPLERAQGELKYDILNRPEISEVGQGIVAYNNDNSLQYINNLSLVVSDQKETENDGVVGIGGASDQAGITAILGENNRCLTMVLGNEGEEHESRVGLDDLYDSLGTGEWDVELFGEIRKKKSYIYSGALYGGYDVSSRSRTEYVSIGAIYDVTEPLATIMSPGDTYVQNYKNTRLTKKTGGVYTSSVMSMVETLEYLVETTINLEERNDSSIGLWDNLVDPTAEEGTNYNRVYSTDEVIQKFTSDNIKLRAIERAEVKIIASKVKIPGEFVDNWVDFRPNEVMYLDGKYGPINNVVNHWDELYAFQDFASAKIAVKPRVQTQGADGVTIELGLGSVLHDYQYISTKSGCINKWGILSTNSGLYYADVNNKQLQRIQPSKGIEGVSEAKGMHSFLRKEMDRDILRKDNPIIGEGVSVGYDVVNGDVFTSLVQEGNDYTLSYNEKMNAYTSFYNFIPSRYITKGDRFFSVPSASGDAIWAHGKENYQNFYGSKYDANITILINTDAPGVEKVFNTIEYDSEVTLNGDDVSDETLDSIAAWTTYQTSGAVSLPLTINDNIKRRFRTWRALVPREENSRNRLRDKWLFLKLGFNPEEDKKLVLYDIIVNYVV